MYNTVIYIYIFGGIKMAIVSPSLLSADFAYLNDELKKVSDSSAEWIHLDIMDGVFVPNLSFGMPVIASIRKVSSLFFDVHLMIEDPIKYVEEFSKAGADAITFHYESKSDVQKTIDKIHSLGKKAGLSIKPNTPAEEIIPFLKDLDLVLVMSVEPGFGGQSFMDSCLPKIRLLREKAPNIHISVDGGINAQTAKLCREAGADVLVAGSYFFGAKNLSEAADSLR